jgi:hypothetical protein
MRGIALLLALAWPRSLAAQASGEAFGLAVKHSLERSHDLYPDAAVPGSPLSQAILFRIDWLNRNNPAFFSDPDWPVKIAAAEGSRLGVRARGAAARRPAAQPEDQRYLGVVTKNFSVTGASFRKGQQIVIEALRDYGKRGVVLVDGQPVVLWLDHIKLLREIPLGEASPRPVKITSARYGLPGTKGYVVSSAVQSALAQNAAGSAELLVSDALLPPAAAQRLNRSATARTVTDPATGQPVPVVSPKVLTVTYEIGGIEKTRQAGEGETLALD